MKNFSITKGRNIYDFFIIPTIRVEWRWLHFSITIEWLKWYVGIRKENT